MFEIIENTDYIFKYLDENFKYSIQLNDDQYFIFTKPSFLLVIYSKQGDFEKLVAFELDSKVHIYHSSMALIQHLEQIQEHENPIYLEAIEALHQHILNIDTSLLFFDAH